MRHNNKTKFMAMLIMLFLFAGCKTGIDGAASGSSATAGDGTGGEAITISRSISGTAELPSSLSASSTLFGLSLKAVDTSNITVTITNFITGEVLGTVTLASDYTFTLPMTDEVIAKMANPNGTCDYIKIAITDGNTIDLGNIVEVCEDASADVSKSLKASTAGDESVDTGETNVTTTSRLDMAIAFGCEATDETCIKNAITLAGQFFDTSEDISLLKVALLKGSDSDLTTDCLSREAITMGAKMRWMRAIKFVTDKCFADKGVKFDQIVSVGGFEDKDAYRRKFSTGMEKLGEREKEGFTRLLRTYCDDMLRVDTILALGNSLFDQGGEMKDFLRGSFKANIRDNTDVRAFGVTFRNMPPSAFNSAKNFEDKMFNGFRTAIEGFKSSGYLEDFIGDDNKAAMFASMMSDGTEMKVDCSDPASLRSAIELTHSYDPPANYRTRDNRNYADIGRAALDQYKNNIYGGSMDPRTLNEVMLYNKEEGAFDDASAEDEIKDKMEEFWAQGNGCNVSSCVTNLEARARQTGVPLTRSDYEGCMRQCYGGGILSIGKASILKSGTYTAADVCGDLPQDDVVVDDDDDDVVVDDGGGDVVVDDDDDDVVVVVVACDYPDEYSCEGAEECGCKYSGNCTHPYYDSVAPANYSIGANPNLLTDAANDKFSYEFLLSTGLSAENFENLMDNCGSIEELESGCVFTTGALAGMLGGDYSCLGGGDDDEGDDEGYTPQTPYTSTFAYDLDFSIGHLAYANLYSTEGSVSIGNDGDFDGNYSWTQSLGLAFDMACQTLGGCTYVDALQVKYAKDSTMMAILAPLHGPGNPPTEMPTTGALHIVRVNDNAGVPEFPTVPGGGSNYTRVVDSTVIKDARMDAYRIGDARFMGVAYIEFGSNDVKYSACDLTLDGETNCTAPETVMTLEQAPYSVDIATDNAQAFIVAVDGSKVYFNKKGHAGSFVPDNKLILSAANEAWHVRIDEEYYPKALNDLARLDVVTKDSDSLWHIGSAALALNVGNAGTWGVDNALTIPVTTTSVSRFEMARSGSVLNISYNTIFEDFLSLAVALCEWGDNAEGNPEDYPDPLFCVTNQVQDGVAGGAHLIYPNVVVDTGSNYWINTSAGTTGGAEGFLPIWFSTTEAFEEGAELPLVNATVRENAD